MKVSLILIFLLLSFSGKAQKQNNIWLFGDRAGLDFNFSPPKPITGSMIALEGCASIANENGELLFYTNGISVWDRNHQLMPNGSGLLGGESSTQAALIVPQPDSPNLYFLFTTEHEFTAGKLAYSLIDMNLNGGLGDVVENSKNTLVTDSVGEKIIAIPHANRHDIWIVTHTLLSNHFLAYLVTPSGLINSPVISSIGSEYTLVYSAPGPIRAAHNGKKIAIAGTVIGVLEFFDFDSQTGELKNAVSLIDEFPKGQYFYGIEFSPNDSLLYLSTIDFHNYIYQIDLYDLNVTILDSTIGLSHGNLQLGPDKKIYIANQSSNALSVIERPNQKGHQCNFKENAVTLADGTLSWGGLPNLVPYAFFPDTTEKPTLGENRIVCLGDSLLLNVDFPINCFPLNFLWSDGSTNSTLLIDEPGNYWVELNTTCGVFTDTLLVVSVECEAIIHYDLNNCRSYMADNSHMDYSEFEAAYPVTLSCGLVNADHLKRSDAAQKHSCTQGIEGSVAMCTGSLQDCEFQPDHPLSIVFEFDITPALDSIVALSQLTFYHKSPEQYSWIDGPSGPNNPPSFFGISIYKNDSLIFRETQVPTGNEWTQASFGFIGDTVFEVADPAHFRIEILPYCPADNGAAESVWDIDEISFFGFCRSIPTKLPSISGYVKTYQGLPVFPAEVRLSPSPGFNTYLSTITSTDGSYRFSNLQPGIAYYITAYKNDHITQGVTTKDLIGLQKHLLMISPYSTLPKLIASDINADDKINVIDLLELRKTVLGLYSLFPQNTSWRFGPASQNFQTQDLHSFEEIHYIESLGTEDVLINITGIKIGDVERN